MKRLLIFTVLFLIFAGHLAFAAEHKVGHPIVRTHIPTLVETVRFSGDIRLCGEKIPFTDQQVRERLEKEMMLAVWNRPQVMLWLKRAHRWFPHIERILKQEKLPMDLKYLPIVESALLSSGESYKGAVGYWQFIKSTGKGYGLRIDSKVDERRDMFCATRAACSYLKDLYSRFGSYILAMSAYNMGENGLSKAIARQGTKDFFSLYLSRETQRYILKMVAVKLILSNPEAYGFHLEPRDLYPVFTFSEIKLSPKCAVPLSMVAKACGVSFKTIKDYNPHIRGYYLEKGSTTLMVPEGKNKEFYKKFAPLYRTLAKKQLSSSSKHHVVKTGENLSAISRRYNLSLSRLRKLNKFSKKHVIHPGDKVRVK